MNTSLRLMLTAVLLGVAAIKGPTLARASAFQATGNVRREVSNMGQTVAFFRDVLGCPLIGGSASATDTGIDGHASARLACGSGSLVEWSLAAPRRCRAQATMARHSSWQQTTWPARHHG
jgi:hypothetical protein